MGARSSGDRLQKARVLLIPLGWSVGFISVPPWAVLSLSPHPHAVLSLALAGGSLLPLLSHVSGPRPSSSPLSGRGGRGALFGRRSCLPRWAPGRVQGQTRPRSAPAAGAGGGVGGEGVGRGRGRVKAWRSPPPEGVTAYKKGAALRHWGCRRRGRSVAAESSGRPPASRASRLASRVGPITRDPGQNVGVQEEGPRPRQEAPRGEEAGVRTRGER